MKPSKMLELVENLKVGEKVIIEKFKDHLFVEKFPSKPGEWIPAPSDNVCRKCGYEKITPTGKVKYSDPQQLEYKCENCGWLFDFLMDNSNVNANGVDLSILNEEDWFYVETSLFKYLFKGDMLNENRRNLTYSHLRGSLDTTGKALCDKDNITLLRKATPEDLAPFFEEYPQYAPVKVGDIGLFYDTVGYESKAIKEDSTLLIGKLEKIVERGYDIEGWGNYKNFFKVSENETIAEIRERFLKETENTI